MTPINYVFTRSRVKVTKQQDINIDTNVHKKINVFAIVPNKIYYYF